jgi:hypothetical protein
MVDNILKYNFSLLPDALHARPLPRRAAGDHERTKPDQRAKAPFCRAFFAPAPYSVSKNLL